MVLKTPNEVEQMVLADLHRDYSDEQLDADGKAGAMLGLFPPGIDLKAETVKLLKSQIAGFYDPHEKEMVLVEGATPVPNHAIGCSNSWFSATWSTTCCWRTS